MNFKAVSCVQGSNFTSLFSQSTNSAPLGRSNFLYKLIIKIIITKSFGFILDKNLDETILPMSYSIKKMFQEIINLISEIILRLTH